MIKNESYLRLKDYDLLIPYKDALKEFNKIKKTEKSLQSYITLEFYLSDEKLDDPDFGDDFGHDDEPPKYELEFFKKMILYWSLCKKYRIEIRDQSKDVKKYMSGKIRYLDMSWYIYIPQGKSNKRDKLVKHIQSLFDDIGKMLKNQ